MRFILIECVNDIGVIYEIDEDYIIRFVIVTELYDINRAHDIKPR